jgi:hypothetical protein
MLWNEGADLSSGGMRRSNNRLGLTERARCRRYNDAFHAGHDGLGDIERMLNHTRDRNPACDVGGGRAARGDGDAAVASAPHDGGAVSAPLPSENEDERAAIEAVGRADAAADAANDAANDASADAAVAAYYVASSAYGQCSEAPLGYLRGCVVPSDYLPYLRSARPVLAPNATCASLGFERVVRDPVFAMDVWWRGGRGAAAAFFGGFAPGHPDLTRFLATVRDQNPACALAATGAR